MTTTPITWANGYYERGSSDIPGVYTATYRLNDLIAQNLIDPDSARNFLIEAGLTEFVWEVTWADDSETQPDIMNARFSAGQGYVVFIHGWTGNHSIWESLPALVAANDRRLISISVDHNGFGQSELIDDTPTLESCNPPAAMKTIEAWVELMCLRNQPQPKVINFVGHSMGGAALFYLDPLKWKTGEETRYAVAPALLLEDEQNQVFFTTLGIGIGIVNFLPVFEIVERALKPNVIDALCHGASSYVKETHNIQYNETARSTTAATFVAMGLLRDREIARNFDLFRVILGHRDRLVDVIAMMDLLNQLEFPAQNIRVVAGTHYLFSVGIDSVFAHAQNRELIVQDIVNLHEQAFALLRQSIRLG